MDFNQEQTDIAEPAYPAQVSNPIPVPDSNPASNLRQDFNSGASQPSSAIPAVPENSANSGVPSAGESIDNVNKSALNYFKAHYLFAISVIVSTGILEILSVIYYFNYYLLEILTPAETPAPAVLFLLAPLMLPILVFVYLQRKFQHEFMKQFAAANGYVYSAKGDLSGLDGDLFRIGNSKFVSDVVSGSYENYPISLFTYQYIIGSGKDRRAYYYTVFKLGFSASMPDILLKSKYVSEDFIFKIKNVNAEYIKLEGDFNKYFTLSVKKGYEVEALEVFTPDVMQELVEKAKSFSLEIINDHLFIYTSKIVSTQKDLYAFYDLAKYFIEKLGPVLARMKPSLEAMSQYQMP